MKRNDEYRHMAPVDMTDEQLLFDLRQIKVSLECGVSSSHEKFLAERQQAIYAVLARRRESRESAEERVENDRRKATKPETLWALISTDAIDPMATDERFLEALDLAKDVVGGREFAAASLGVLASALVDMEDDLAQARGLLVMMNRAAKKWRDIARGEALDTEHLSQEQLSLLLGMLIANVRADSKDCEPEWRMLYQTLSAAKAKKAKR